MRRISAACLAALAVAAAGCGASVHRGALLPPSRVNSHVVVIVMENLAYSDVIGSPEFPYLNSIAPRGAVPVQMFGLAHPSLPNYLAMIGGDTFAVRSDDFRGPIGSPTLVDQLTSAGFTWKAYMQGMPRPCFKGSFYGTYPPGYRYLDKKYQFLSGYGQRYAKKHDPFMYFDSVLHNPRQCERVVPLTELSSDLRTGTLPAFAFVSPDRCYDTHDCVLPAGDRFLRTWVPRILPRLGPHGYLEITWDEGSSNRGCCGGLARGGRIPTLLLGPDVLAGGNGQGDYDHYSTLRTIEDAFGLPYLRRAGHRTTQPLDALFVQPPRFRG